MAKKEKSGAPAAFRVLTPLRVDGVDIAPDSTVEFTPDLSAQLLESGAIEPAPEVVPAAPPAPPAA